MDGLDPSEACAGRLGSQVCPFTGERTFTSPPPTGQGSPRSWSLVAIAAAIVILSVISILFEGKIGASGTNERMYPILEWSDPSIDEACFTAPRRDVTAFKVLATHGAAPYPDKHLKMATAADPVLGD